jgi:hypothetical protein
MRQAKRELTAPMVAAAGPAAARAIAQSGDYPLPLRLAAAERAAALGGLDPEALAQVYLAHEPAPAELQNPIGAARGDTGPKARALLYRAARAQANPEAKAELITAALESARAAPTGSQGGYFAAARLYRPLIETIEPAPELATFAIDAARALYASDAPSRARAWVDLVRRRAGTDPQSAAAAVRLGPVAWLADGSGRLDAAPVLAWAEADRKRAPAGADERQALLYGLIEAMGTVMPPAAWAGLLEAPRVAQPPLPLAALSHMRSASAGARPAEAVALILAMAGDREAGAAGALLAPEIVTELRALGLEPVARRFAVEAVLTGGL